MRDKETAKLAVWIVFTLLLMAGGVFVGIIKIMAWWQIAMHGCAS